MSDQNNFASESGQQTTREKIHEIIFEADTPLGAIFDIGLLIAIVASVIITCLATVEEYKDETWINSLSWVFTAFFTVEYLLRIYCVRKPWNYIFSFWGMIDLL